MLQGLPSSHPPLLQGRTPAKNANKHRILQRSYLRSMIKVDSEDGKTRFSGVPEYAGDHPCTVCDGPTKRPQYMRISRLITVTYLQNNFGVIFRQWQPAKPRTGMSIIWIFLCQTISIWQQHWLWRYRPIPVRCNGSVFACKMHSTPEFAMTVLSKCQAHPVSKGWSK